MSVKFIENTLRGKQKICTAQPDAGWGLFRRAGWTPARVRMADHKGVKVFVGNLPPEAESRDLRDFFKVLLLLMYANNLRNDGSFQQDFGAICDVWVARKPPGFGFVWFEMERDAV